MVNRRVSSNFVQDRSLSATLGAITNRLKAELSNVQIISGASEGFAAIRADGTIICWDRIGQVDVKVAA